MAIQVQNLYAHPIKSCGAVRLRSAQINERGIEGDRTFMIVDENGVMVTQRASTDVGSIGIPHMCLITPALGQRHLTVRAPGMGELEIPWQGACTEPFAARIWSDTCSVVEVSREASEWVTDFLAPFHRGTYRLVRMCDDTERRAAEGNAPISFADAFPLLVISQASLDNLNRRLGTDPVGMDRFRPNIVLMGSEVPHFEDHITRMRIHDIEFTTGRLCDRCSVPGIDQASGLKDGRPLKELVRYRRIAPETSGSVQFGVNFSHQGTGHVEVGDRVEICESAHEDSATAPK